MFCEYKSCICFLKNINAQVYFVLKVLKLKISLFKENKSFTLSIPYFLQFFTDVHNLDFVSICKYSGSHFM